MGVYLKNEARHWRERIKKARFLWEQVRRLTRLPPKAKKAIVCGQLIPVLSYGCEAFEKPNEEMTRLARQWARWVVGAWSSSSIEKVRALSRVEDLAELFWKKKVRWAASVYGRYLPILKHRAQEILNDAYHTQNVRWRWMDSICLLAEREQVMIQEWRIESMPEYSDGSRVEDVAAGATTRMAEYLGHHAIVMDAEMLGISLALESNQRNIALDSQAAIIRTTQLYIEPARSWIELRIQRALKAAPCTVMWVKGHAGVEGNKEADRKANLRAYGGRVMGVGRCDDSRWYSTRLLDPLETKTPTVVKEGGEGTRLCHYRPGSSEEVVKNHRKRAG